MTDDLLDEKTWHGQIYSGGWTASHGGDRTVVEPATGGTLGTIGVADATDVADACATAAKAQRAWAETSFEERAAILRRAGQIFEARQADIITWLVREGGATRPKSAFEISLVAGECYEAAGLAARPLGEILNSNQPRLSLARRVPVGVVGVISPFNFPLILAMRSVAPALAVGNAVVLKPDLRTAVSGGFSVAQVFAEAGLPEGLLHVLPGAADAGTALVEHPATRVVSFTGATSTGRVVGELAARHLKRVHLELGGNSALIVLDDADLDRAVSAGAWGSFLHQGQICMTTGRHLVHESIADAYVEGLSAHARHLPVGDPWSGEVALGPLIDAGQRDKVHQLVTSTVDSGARLAAGGTFEELFYQPTVLDGVSTDAPAYTEEVFGPVAPVVRFSTLDEAVALASQTDMGLSLGILTGNPLRALKLAERIPTGIVHINDQTVNDEAVAPFGGILDSGTGARFGGNANLDAFTDTRWITMRDEIPQYPF
jgi:benzaldehyde dehydrogenase (NAD)